MDGSKKWTARDGRRSMESSVLGAWRWTERGGGSLFRHGLIVHTSVCACTHQFVRAHISLCTQHVHVVGKAGGEGHLLAACCGQPNGGGALGALQALGSMLDSTKYHLNTCQVVRVFPNVDSA